MSQTKAQLLDGKSATIQFNGGSASAPAVSFTGDTNTGIYSPGADQVAISTNSAERMRITATGVGVGTSTPVSGAQLTVAGSALAVTGQNLDHSANSIRIGQEGSGAAQIRCYGPNTSTNGSLAFKMSRSDGTNSQDVVIDGSGRLGIGTTSPGTYAQLAVFGAVSNFGQNISGIFYNPNGPSSTITIQDNTSASGGGIGSVGNNLVLYSNSGANLAERARIDSNGRLLVGTSSARANFYNAGVSSQNQIEGTTDQTSSVAIIQNYNAATYGAQLILAKSNASSIGSNTLVASGDACGRVTFQGNDGADFVEAARIEGVIDGTPGANDMPGRLVFSVTRDGEASPTGRAQIDNTGRFYTFNAAATEGACFMTAEGAGTTYQVFGGWRSATTVGGASAQNVFRVYTNGNTQNTNNSYTGISDIKLKENIVDAGSQWSDIKSLQVRKFNFKEETGHQTHTQIGLIAQEAELVSPGLVYESPDRDAEGNDLGTTTKSVQYSVLYMKAVKALQEAMERIETLETSNTDLLARVSALESA